ncbi:hypothetical protein SGGMMB4_04259 [Sodalis glossinidius str. 'morsitans']|uniref:Excisionase n=1 Tax=Sodalis glossinidius (strain morsitans) TaxID=343509 RepID=A0A193QLR0_SODGM|nr:excisionase [Sodalis glossinidius]CRL46033.1 hypothetical protein SGGMMB4_04259 [Sodalis glossinidius str. 'morsitans']
MISFECIPISTYCKNTGENIEAINKRIQRGLCREGVQVLKIDGVKERWIDLSEVCKWARKNNVANYRAESR